MISDGTFEEFECAGGDDKHFIKQPIILPSCGHSICKNCLPKETNSVIYCKICGEMTNRDLSNDKEAISLKKSLKKNLDSLFIILEKQTSNQLNKLKTCMENEIDKVNLCVNYICEEIDIRIESLKNSLDILGFELKNELDSIKIEIEKSNVNFMSDKTNEIKSFENEYSQLTTDIKNKKTDNEDRFYEYQSTLKRLNKLIKDFESGDYNLNFEVSNFNLNKNLIGKINYKNLKEEQTINISNREKLRKGEYKIIDLDFRPFDSIILPNDTILFANRDDKKLTLCNNDYKVIKIIDKIDNKIFYPEAIAFNGIDRVYFTNRDTHEVIMTDLDFNKIKSFGSMGNDNFQFNDPCGICYIYDYIYICDSKNERIQILDNDLKYVRTVKLNYEPWLIKASNDLICIERNDGKGINFYDIKKDFTILSNYNNGWGKISMMNSCFYECCVKKKKIFCYDKNGVSIEDIDIDRFDSIISNSWDGYLVYFKKKLLMLCYNKRKIIEFS